MLNHMKIKITVDKFCSRKGLKRFQSFSPMPTAQEIYEIIYKFLGGRGKFEDIDRLMRDEQN